MPSVKAERDLVVVSREQVADGVIALTLADPTDASLPAWEPGAHVDIHLGTTGVRQYSLIGDPADRRHWRIAILRQPGGRGGSLRIHDQLQVGSTVGCGLPRNAFPLVMGERVAFVAGGIGITPILPMVRSAEAAGLDWTLLYGGRTRASMAFVDELTRFGDRVRLWPEDELGLLPLDDHIDRLDAGSLVYCCGPEPLLQAIEKVCERSPRLTLHLERFSPCDAASAEGDGGENAIEVVLELSGHEIRVLPDQTILEAVEARGVSVLSSCRNGICGTCETPVIEGRPDHRDAFLDDAERQAGKTMMICVSRSLTPRLVLEL